MYKNLGIHWASSIPAFLSLALAPFPFLFYKYGHQLRLKCKYAAEAEAFMQRLAAEADDTSSQEEKGQKTAADELSDEKRTADKQIPAAGKAESKAAARKERGEGEKDAETEDEVEDERLPGEPKLERIKTTASGTRWRRVDWDDNPYVIDRVNTRESFGSGRARTKSF
jgi:hypothetical protein